MKAASLRLPIVVMDAFYTFLADDGWAIASHIALSTLMALFPFLIVLTSLAGFFGSKELADRRGRACCCRSGPSRSRIRCLGRDPRRADHDARRHPDHRRGAGRSISPPTASRRCGSRSTAPMPVVEMRRWYWLRLESIGYTLVAAFTSLAMAFLIVLGPLIIEAARRYIPFFVEIQREHPRPPPATASRSWRWSSRCSSCMPGCRRGAAASCRSCPASSSPCVASLISGIVLRHVPGALRQQLRHDVCGARLGGHRAGVPLFHRRDLRVTAAS